MFSHKWPTHTKDQNNNKFSSLFPFDWNNYKTIEASEKAFDEVKAIIAANKPVVNHLRDGDRYDLALLCYKVATFYNHIKIKQSPKTAANEAIILLDFAIPILRGDDLNWARNHLAFSYQQKLAAAKKDDYLSPTQREETLDRYSLNAYKNYSPVQNDTLESTDHAKIKIYAFSLCVQALVQYEQGYHALARRSYREALDLYESIGALDDQYARDKNRYAMILAEDGFTDKALQTFKELDTYWTNQHDAKNPYKARCYEQYGDFLIKLYPNDSSLGLAKLNKAHEILCETDGVNAHFTLLLKNKIEKIENQHNEHHSPKPHKG